MATLVYDADCGFCTASASWLARRGGFDIQAWQFIDDLSAHGLNEKLVEEAAHWVDDGERVASGSDAIGRALIARGGAMTLAGRFVLSPIVRPAARRAYAIIARNRHLMPGGTVACKIPQHPERLDGV